MGKGSRINVKTRTISFLLCKSNKVWDKSLLEIQEPFDSAEEVIEKEAVVTAIESHYDSISAPNYAGAYDYFSFSRNYFHIMQ